MPERQKPARTISENREDNDFSHLMITSANYPDTSVVATDGTDSTMFWHGHPDYENSPFRIQDVSTHTQTTSSSANMDQYPSDGAWSKTGGISLDGLFVPYSTNFVIRSESGQVKDKNRPSDGAAMPSFERPYSVLDKDDVLKETVIYSGPVVTHPALGPNAPSPTHITSISLNPFASGHHIQIVNKNEEITNPVTKNTGFSIDTSNLVSAKEVSVNTERPVGLRGPLVVAGWGYDTIGGFPVPNMRDDSDYREGDYKETDFGKQKHVPSQMRAKNIVGLEKDHKHFIPHHLSRQDKWKVGPVDLRWDNQRKVWSGGKHNGIYLSKTAKCILPKAGMDGNNSFDLGVGGNITSPGRLYRNPCPTRECTYQSYFPTSLYYPDIEIYDPEDHNWCGVCKTFGNITACGDFADGCVPFYDGFILRSVEELVGEKNTVSDCTDKFRKAQGGHPHARRAGNPCHGWGSSYMGVAETINAKIGKDETWTQYAKHLLYEKIFIENPMGQGLMAGDAFFSYDTGKRVSHTYKRSDTPGCGGQGGKEITVTESIPVHIILQGEFYGMEIITHAGCDRGEMAACSRKFFAQGFATGEDCGPDDDYPNTSIRSQTE